MSDPIDECRGPDAVCKWNHKRSAHWEAAVAAAPWRKLGEGEWLKSLDCPRCGDAMTVSYRLEGPVIFAAIEELRELYGATSDFDERIAEVFNEPEEHAGFGGSRSAKKTPARCNCVETHSGQPEGDRAGCGQWGVIDAPGE
jgi:hypothetical protein